MLQPKPIAVGLGRNRRDEESDLTAPVAELYLLVKWTHAIAADSFAVMASLHEHGPYAAADTDDETTPDGYADAFMITGIDGTPLTSTDTVFAYVVATYDTTLVSSPSNTCFGTCRNTELVREFKGAVIIGSVFDSMVADLSPSILYLMPDEDTMDVGLDDASGNGYDFSVASGYQGPTAIPPMRKELTYAARMVAHNAGNSFKGTALENTIDSTAINALLQGSTNFCMQLSYRATATLAVGDMALLGMCAGVTTSTAYPMTVVREVTSDDVEMQIQATNGGIPAGSSDGPLNDGAGHIITMVNDATRGFRVYVDGVITHDGGQVAPKTLAGMWRGNVQANAAYTTQDWDTDHIAVWGTGDTLPTEEEVLELHEQFAKDLLDQ